MSVKLSGGVVIYVLVLLVAIPFASTLLFFLAIDQSSSFRHHLNPEWIRYYALKDRYTQDKGLVFIPKYAGPTFSWETRGDLYSPLYNVEVEPMKSTWSYTPDGFRKNSSNGRPTDLLVVGDFFIEVGETDSDTLSEQIAQKTGMATFNLGRGWYGPFQYLELFRRYAPKIKPSCAMLSFYNGNDAKEMEMYQRWANGGSYYDWPPFEPSIFTRYWLTLQGIMQLIEKRFSEISSKANRATFGSGVHPDLALVQLGDKEVPMAFIWGVGEITKEVLGSDELATLESIMRDFWDTGASNRIRIFIVFIPTKTEVYSGLLSKTSGSEVLKNAELETKDSDAMADALKHIADTLSIPYVNLLPDFRVRAAKGELLYYPFDSHWNSTGRQAAAELIAEKLKNQSLCGQTHSARMIAPPTRQYAAP